MNRMVEGELLEQGMAESGLGSEDAQWGGLCPDEASCELPMWAERANSYRRDAELLVEALRQVTEHERISAVRVRLRNRGASNRLTLSKLVLRAARQAQDIRSGLRKLGARDTLPLNRLIIRAARHGQKIDHASGEKRTAVPTVWMLRAALVRGRSERPGKSRWVQRGMFRKSEGKV